MLAVKIRTIRPLALVAICLLMIAGCKKETPAAAQPTLVSIVNIQTEPAQVTTELPGRVSAVKDAQIRARVTGIVQKIVFKLDPSFQYKFKSAEMINYNFNMSYSFYSIISNSILDQI